MNWNLRYRNEKLSHKKFWDDLSFVFKQNMVNGRPVKIDHSSFLKQIENHNINSRENGGHGESPLDQFTGHESSEKHARSLIHDDVDRHGIPCPVCKFNDPIYREFGGV